MTASARSLVNIIATARRLTGLLPLVAMSLAFAAVLGGCGKKEDTQEPKLLIGLSLADLKEERW